MYRYEFTPKSVKQFRKLEKKVQFRIIRKLDHYCSDSNPLNFAEPLSDWEFGEYRFRIGSYRVIFDIKDNLITIHGVGDRKDVYK